MTYDEFKKLLTSLVVDYKHSRRVLRDERAKLKEAKAHEAVVLSAQKLAQETAAALQQKVHEHISGIVTRCIQAVFPEPYSFGIEFTQKRGKTEAEMCFYLNGHKIDPMEQSGGGLIDVSAFALQIAKLTLEKPPKRRFLALDEPFRYICKEYSSRVRQLVLSVSEEMKIQIVMITHNEDLICGKIIDLDREVESDSRGTRTLSGIDKRSNKIRRSNSGSRRRPKTSPKRKNEEVVQKKKRRLPPN